MRFLVDVHHIGSRATGNETWARESTLALIRRSAAEPDVELSLAASAPVGPIYGDSIKVDRVSGSSWRRLVLELPRVARANGTDALLVQYTAPMTTVPSVVAIHDLSFTHPVSGGWIPPRERARMNTTIRWSARRAACVVALSQHTAEDLCEQWGIPPEKVVIAYPAVAPAFLERLKASTPHGGNPPDEPRILIVGNVLPRKNHLVVARAVAMLRDRGIKATLRIAGQVPPAGSDVASRLRELGAGWLTITGYLDDEALVKEYLEADVMCYPSLYEGFGIPVLEGMAAGLPVIVSDATALPEAAGDAGLIVPARDPEAWADAIEAVTAHPGRAEDMRTRGFAHEKSFSWDITAGVLLDALRRAADG